MTDLSAQQLVSATVHATAAAVWGGIALRAGRALRPGRSRMVVVRLLRNMTTFAAVFYACQAALRLVPDEVAGQPPVWLICLWTMAEAALVFAAVTARHLTCYWGVRFEPPTRAWLAGNYGSAALMMALAIATALGGAPLQGYEVARSVYVVAVLGLALASMARVARRGAWQPGAAANVIRGADVGLFAVGIATMVLAIVLTVGGVDWRSPWRGVAIDALIAIAVLTPMAVRELHAALRSLAIASGTVAIAVAVVVGGRALVAPLAARGAVRLADVLLILAFVAGAAIVASLASLVDRALFRRHRHLWEELQEFLATLAPQDGVVTCCRRALGEVVRALGLRGAAIILRDGEAVAEGSFDVAKLAQVWPRGEALDALPVVISSPEQIADLPPPVIEALIDAQVIGILSIASPRRRWGVLFGTSGLIEPTPDDAPAVEAFTAQLALVLDAAALIEQVVGVERSLAHAEKLAAIGEVAARIAHEIRNPVTAARSLAQLMREDPLAPENAESVGLILSELERVERHVRDLLRFARREEYAKLPVDLGDLARDAIEPFAPRLAAADVAVTIDATPGVIVRGDREKLRQVLVNLVENALDALGDVAERRLAVSVARTNGAATLRVTDTGPGIPHEALARVFEPFFSTKATGTGLGLAIVRRIIDAHGGRISAESAPRRGATFRIDFPS